MLKNKRITIKKSYPSWSENTTESPDFLKHFWKFCVQALLGVNGHGGGRMKKYVGALLYIDFWNHILETESL